MTTFSPKSDKGADALPPSPELDRRKFMKCCAWAGTGVVWSLVGGIPTAFANG